MAKQNNAQVVTGAKSFPSGEEGAASTAQQEQDRLAQAAVLQAQTAATARQDKAVRDAAVPVESELPESIVYQSIAASYAFQVTPGRKRVDPATGISEDIKPIVARFVDGFYVASRDAHGDDYPLIVKRLESRREFGIGRDYWRAADLAKAAKVAQVESLKLQLAAIAADPELVKALSPQLASFANPKKSDKSDKSDAGAPPAPVTNPAGAPPPSAE